MKPYLLVALPGLILCAAAGGSAPRPRCRARMWAAVAKWWKSSSITGVG